VQLEVDLREQLDIRVQLESREPKDLEVLKEQLVELVQQDLLVKLDLLDQPGKLGLLDQQELQELKVPQEIDIIHKQQQDLLQIHYQMEQQQHL
jgi:hypothetical protein